LVFAASRLHIPCWLVFSRNFLNASLVLRPMDLSIESMISVHSSRLYDHEGVCSQSIPSFVAELQGIPLIAVYPPEKRGPSTERGFWYLQSDFPVWSEFGELSSYDLGPVGDSGSVAFIGGFFHGCLRRSLVSLLRFRQGTDRVLLPMDCIFDTVSVADSQFAYFDLPFKRESEEIWLKRQVYEGNSRECVVCSLKELFDACADKRSFIEKVTAQYSFPPEDMFFFYSGAGVLDSEGRDFLFFDGPRLTP